MTESRRRISELQEGMIISKDIISDEGIFLIPANTTINKNHILKMQLYQIAQADVFDQPGMVETTQKELLMSQTPEFKSFTSKYISQVHELEKELSKILETGHYDQTGLTQIVTDLIESSPSNQLFSYLCRIRSQDDFTFTHSLNVSILANIFAKWLHLEEEDIINLSIAGLLHDIGKTQLDLAVLNKKGKLTNEEFELIKTHTTLGYKIIENAPLDIGVKQAILLHHERMNGSGYPLNVPWDYIHRYAKIIAIVDIYDAMTSDRPYHKRYHPFVVIRNLEEESYGLLDTDLLFVFLENIAHHFLGNDVLLSSGEEGKIIFINPKSPSRPIIQVKNKFVDLLSNDQISIEKFL